MTQLTEELFRYSVVLSVPLAQSLQEVSVNRILEGSIAAMYAVLKRHRITPDITMTDHTVLRTLDPSSLSRVFSNLLNNAVKYSDGDLSITLSEDGTITFSNTAAALSEVEVGRLFDRFYTVENAKNATGLDFPLRGRWWNRCTGRWMPLMKRGGLSSGCIFSLFYSSIFLLCRKV